MRPVEPVLSPVVWTSIASGKSPEKHGVQAWTVTRDGRERVVDGRNVKVRRFWNILDERGVRTAVLSWLVSFPPRPMAHGFLVSDRFTRGDWVGTSDAPLYEEGGRDALERTYGVTPAASTEWALSFSPTRADADAAPFQEATAGLPGGLFPWARDENTTRLAEAAVKRFDPAVLALYLKGVDEVQHLFLQFTDPGLRAQLAADPSLYLRLGAQGGGLRLPWQGAPLTPEHLAVAASLVDDYVAHTDGLLARVLAAAGGDPDVVVVSDHGFLLRADPGGVPAPDHSDRAVLLLSGPSFRTGATLDDPSALDVTPTLLHLLGHPVPRDADGRVLTEALAYDRPVERVDTYDATPLVLPEVGNARTPTERLEEERLRTLGYIR